MDEIAQELYSLIQKEIEKKTLFIVEGEKDRKALSLLGVEYIITLQTKPLYKVIEEVADIAPEVVILTDLDKEGKKLYAKLRAGLSPFGIRIDNTLRYFILKNTTLQQMEGLDTFLQKRIPHLL